MSLYRLTSLLVCFSLTGCITLPMIPMTASGGNPATGAVIVWFGFASILFWLGKKLATKTNLEKWAMGLLKLAALVFIVG
jgi:hypothetical protein